MKKIATDATRKLNVNRDEWTEGTQKTADLRRDCGTNADEKGNSTRSANLKLFQMLDETSLQVPRTGRLDCGVHQTFSTRHAVKVVLLYVKYSPLNQSRLWPSARNVH